MSENLDLVRSIYADWERGDFRSTDWADPEIEFVFADGPSPGRWTGPEGLREGFREWGSVWEGFRIEADGYRELDDEHILVLTQGFGRGKTSGLEMGQMQTEGAAQFHVRHGAVTRLVIYIDRERAFADLGLAPEDDSR